MNSTTAQSLCQSAVRNHFDSRYCVEIFAQVDQARNKEMIKRIITRLLRPAGSTRPRHSFDILDSSPYRCGYLGGIRDGVAKSLAAWAPPSFSDWFDQSPPRHARLDLYPPGIQLSAPQLADAALGTLSVTPCHGRAFHFFKFSS